MTNQNYRCFKCEGKNSLKHGFYCPNKKNNVEILLDKIKKQEDELYKEKDYPHNIKTTNNLEGKE